MALTVLGGERFKCQETLDRLLDDVRERVAFNALVVCDNPVGVDALVCDYAARRNVCLRKLAPPTQRDPESPRSVERRQRLGADYWVLFVDEQCDDLARRHRFTRLWTNRNGQCVCRYTFGCTGAIYEAAIHSARCVDDIHVRTHRIDHNGGDVGASSV